MGQKILVIKHGAFGDFILCTGVFKRIRQQHADDHVVLMTTQPYEKIAQQTGYFDEIVVDPRSSNIHELIKLRQFFLNHKFDFVYDLQNSSRTAVYFWLSYAKHKTMWSGAGYGYSHRQTCRERNYLPTHIRFADQLKQAGIEISDPKLLLPDISWMCADVTRFNLSDQPYTLLVPGSSRKGLVKRWGHDKYAELARWLIAQNIQPVIIGGHEEQDVTDYIHKHVPDVINLSRQANFAEIATLARGACAAIGNDTGPTHLIIATGCRTLIIWSNFSDPNVYGPVGEHVNIIFEANLQDLAVKRVQDVLNTYICAHDNAKKFLKV